MTGCSVGPSYIPPCIEIPSEWKNENEKCAGCEGNKDLMYLDFWWQVFDDDKLNELESLAIENNKDLYVAFERIQESRALMGIAAAAFYPQINLNPLYTNTGELVKNYINPNNTALNALSTGNTVFRAHELSYFMPLNLNYEVDLWGESEINMTLPNIIG